MIIKNYTNLDIFLTDTEQLKCPQDGLFKSNVKETWITKGLLFNIIVGYRMTNIIDKQLKVRKRILSNTQILR